jgi:hypothetical protein
MKRHRGVLRRRYGHARRGVADYEVTVERQVLIRGRTKPDTYETVVTVYNAKSAADARKAVSGKVVRVQRIL